MEDVIAGRVGVAGGAALAAGEPLPAEKKGPPDGGPSSGEETPGMGEQYAVLPRDIIRVQRGMASVQRNKIQNF